MAPVDSILAVLGEKGENITDLLENGSAKQTAEVSEATQEEPQNIQGDTEKTEPVSMVVEKPSEDVRLKASPLAKKMASEKGIDLRTVSGSGDGGRIVKKDIESFVPDAAIPKLQSILFWIRSVLKIYLSPDAKDHRQEVIRIQIHGSALLPDDRCGHGSCSRTARGFETGGCKVSFNDLVIKASAMALKNHPKVNSSWMGDSIRINHHVHMGVAVAVEDGLLVPVVRHADMKGLQTISAKFVIWLERPVTKSSSPRIGRGTHLRSPIWGCSASKSSPPSSILPMHVFSQWSHTRGGCGQKWSSGPWAPNEDDALLRSSGGGRRDGFSFP